MLCPLSYPGGIPPLISYITFHPSVLLNVIEYEIVEYSLLLCLIATEYSQYTPEHVACMINSLYRRSLAPDLSLLFSPFLLYGIVLENVIVSSPTLNVGYVWTAPAKHYQLRPIATEYGGCSRAWRVNQRTLG